LIELLPAGQFQCANNFIAIEGVDGSGKSTLVGRMPGILDTIVGSSSVRSVRQPGSTTVGNAARDILKGDIACTLDPRVQHMLFQTARMDLLFEIQGTKKERLSSNTWVICDRHEDSTEVYQSEDGVPRQDINLAKELLWGLPTPDVTIFLDVKPETVIQRLIQRDTRDARDTLDKNLIARRIFVYKSIIRRAPHKYFVVDANGTTDQTVDYIEKNLKLIPRR
jgi:dTMP kinase